MADDAGRRDDEGLVEGAKEMAQELKPSRLDDRLGEAIEERPLARHLLDVRLALIAVAIAIVPALVLLLLGVPRIAAVVLVVVFAGAWYGLAYRSYERRRRTREAGESEGAKTDEDDDSAGDETDREGGSGSA